MRLRDVNECTNKISSTVNKGVPPLQSAQVSTLGELTMNVLTSFAQVDSCKQLLKETRANTDYERHQYTHTLNTIKTGQQSTNTQASGLTKQ